MTTSVRLITLTLMTLILTGCPMNDSNSSDNPPSGPRTPQEIMRDGNHLINEPSVYLQQHAHNPMDWYPWGEEALARARAEDKPIFLSIGYSSCHWCHVMEHEVFEHIDVAEFMNEHFICIKVDREERPDLDSVYMEAVQMITGRGGWPMSVFLTPNLEPFHGGTYFPKDHFMQLVGQIVTIYNEKRNDLENQAGQIAERIASASMTNETAGGPLDDDHLAAAVASGKESYDPINAGFDQGQKFPTPVKWRFLLHEHRRRGDEELAEMIIATLEAMQSGGIYDHVGGGFHRYTVDVRWTVPHFEKMLYDNGQLAGLFLEAGVVFDRSDFTATGLDVCDFLLADMQGDEGGFFGSYDADSGGEEGTYYVWSRDDITAAVGETDGPALADVLGITIKGNFEQSGSSVLTRRADLDRIAAERDRSVEELEALFPRYRNILRKVRDERTPPGLDRKIITSWNGLAIASLAQGYAVTGEAKYLDGARKTADFLLENHRDKDGSLSRSSSEGRTRGEGILDDYAFFADGLMEIYQVSGDTQYLRAAKELIDFARAEFRREEGGFYMASRQADSPLGRRVDYFDSVIPSGMAVMFTDMIKLGALTGETVYLTEVKNDLERWSGLLERAGMGMAWWFDAAARLIGPYHDVVIAGDPADPATIALSRTILELLPASAVISLIPADGADKDLLAVAPALDGKKSVNGAPTAFVCEFGICQAPTSDPDTMRTQILQGWRK
ncbi:MAG: thioredoxin domain-containing protein [Candidatus Krumholzibacteria bacterium]|nr:thioredoxin domain-containing protein [Candidatus Krumholzibacteria bacterium]